MTSRARVEARQARNAATDWVGKSPLWFVIGLGLLSLIGCSQASESSSSRTYGASPQGESSVMVCGVDRSGSYDFARVGLGFCERLIRDAGPGDVVIVRWISGASYANSEFVTRLDLERVRLPDCSGNPFDRACRQRRLLMDSRIEAAKGAEMRRLHQVKPERADHTDIYGLLQAAADAFETEPAGMQRELYLATDLKDNMRRRAVPRLTAVQVHVVLFQTGADPAEVLKLRTAWEKWFRAMGATRVTFEPAEGAP